MAAFHRCLCVILTLWMASSRPSVPVLPEASASGAWWGTPDSKKLAKQADVARRSGDLPSAEALFKQGLDDAVRRHDQRAMVGYLNCIAACRLSQSHYREALETLLEAKRLAKSIGDRDALGTIAVNLSSLYFQVWDFEAALREAQEGSDVVASMKHPRFLPNLLLQTARLHQKMERDGQAVSLYKRGIQAADVAGNKPLQALGLDLLAESLLNAPTPQNLRDAESAMGESIHLREQFAPQDLGYSWGWMGALKLAQGEPSEAARYTGLALHSKVRASEYLLKNQMGRIQMASGDRAGALANFREAVQLASLWRLGVLPASGSLSAANENLEQIFTSFIEVAAREAIRTGSSKLAEEAFLAVELNRAASLREGLEFSQAWHHKVPPEYWEMLGRLRAADSRMMGQPGQSTESRSLRLELAEMEAKAGLGLSAKNSEINTGRTSLIHFQQGLSESEVLLSFHLGKQESYVWAVTRETLQMQRIAAESEIRAQVLALSAAVRAGRPEAVQSGEQLFQTLFAPLGQIATKQTWLLSLDGALFGAPFAALVTERKDGKVSYLVSKHSVQTIPGALLLSRLPGTGTEGFLGVGDPIYNVADLRWQGKTKLSGIVSFLGAWSATEPVARKQYGRLVGSGQEVELSGSAWAGKPMVLLEGAAARRDLLLAGLAKRPAVIHLATHVVYSNKQAFLAFGLGPNGESEYLTTMDIASLTVPGALVAMTGCDTGFGLARPGAGLEGLTRAWQMAGAANVLATSWPVPDSNGEIFGSYYRHLHHTSPAEALRQSQLEMLNSGTWRAAPSYWASYQITGASR